MTDTSERTDTAARGASVPAETALPRVGRREKGYDVEAVDAFLAAAKSAFEGGPDADAEGILRADAVREASFPLVRGGYRISPVDAALTRIEDVFAQRHREEEIARIGAAAWVERARDDAQVILDRLSRDRRTRFRRVGWPRFGYRVDEVDLVADKLRAYFASGAPVTVDQVRSVAFRMQRRGYDEAQVDAVLDAAVDVMLAVR